MKFLKSLLVCATILIASIATVHSGSMTLLGAGSSGGGGGGGCVPGTHATTFLARTSGLSGTETTAYCNLINGLDTDGTFALLDALYIYATNTTTTANLNLVSTSFTLTPGGTVSFAADVGYTGDGSTGFLDTGLIPSGSGNWKIASSSLGIAIQTNDTSSVTQSEIGTQDSGGTTFDFLLPSFGLTTYWTGGSSTNLSTASTTSRGMWSGTNTTASAAALYHNGSATAITSGTNTSTALPGFSFFILALNSGSTGSGFSTRQVSAAWIGGGLTGAQYLALATRINAYLTALGVNVY